MEAGAAQRDGRIINDGLLEVQTDRLDGHWSVQLSGDLDLGNVGTLETELQQLDGRPVQLDLSGLGFMDSSAVSLLRRMATARGPNGHLTVIVGNGQPANMLRLCGIDTLLQSLV